MFRSHTIPLLNFPFPGTGRPCRRRRRGRPLDIPRARTGGGGGGFICAFLNYAACSFSLPFAFRKDENTP